jgi:hypothetical protein
MGNVCVRAAQLAHVEAAEADPVQTQSAPAPASAAAVSNSSPKAADTTQAAPTSPRPPKGSRGGASPRPAPKKCCFAEGPATEWQIPAADAQPAASPAQPEQP